MIIMNINNLTIINKQINVWDFWIFYVFGKKIYPLDLNETQYLFNKVLNRE